MLSLSAIAAATVGLLIAGWGHLIADPAALKGRWWWLAQRLLGAAELALGVGALVVCLSMPGDSLVKASQVALLLVYGAFMGFTMVTIALRGEGGACGCGMDHELDRFHAAYLALLIGFLAATAGTSDKAIETLERIFFVLGGAVFGLTWMWATGLWTMNRLASIRREKHHTVMVGDS